MPNPNLTDVTVLLDRSQSMSSIREATEQGLNEYIQSLRNDNQDLAQMIKEGKRSLLTGADIDQLQTRVTVALFDADQQYNPSIEIVHDAVPAEQIGHVGLSPRGNTPLLYAMGTMIDRTGARLAAMSEEERPGTVLFVTVTDGDENCSQGEFSESQGGRDRIRERVELQEGVYKWDFVYLGANQNAIMVAAQMGISQGKAMNYVPDMVHTSGMYQGLMEGTRNLRAAKMMVGAADAGYEISANHRAMAGDSWVPPGQPGGLDPSKVTSKP